MDLAAVLDLSRSYIAEDRVEEFAYRLKLAMLRADLTQPELARLASNVSGRTYTAQKIADLAMPRRTPTVQTVLDLADALANCGVIYGEDSRAIDAAWFTADVAASLGLSPRRVPERAGADVSDGPASPLGSGASRP